MLGCGALCAFANTAMAGFGSILFSFFIVYDTNRICCDDKYIDNWVLGCIDLYLDIINLFIQILQLIGSRRE